MEAWGTRPRPLSVLKFGGTSVADANCIRHVATLASEAHTHKNVVVVVSAMAGVTNELLRAAEAASNGDMESSDEIVRGLERRHSEAIEQLIADPASRAQLAQSTNDLLQDVKRWCAIVAGGELTAQLRDAIASVGERLSAPILAATLQSLGARSESIEATELILTDGFFGAAEPRMPETRERSEARLRGVLQLGTIPVITGFIGETEHGVLTTLGRGGSDYSATILAAALGADEVVIWTDVDGILTADPRVIPSAQSIPQISYREAAELARFGAKVLHPKTLWPVNESGIPVIIRSTFLPSNPGTRIVPNQHAGAGGLKGVSVVAEATLIAVPRRANRTIAELLKRTARAAESVRADILLLACSPGNDRVTISVGSAHTNDLLQELEREFSPDFAGAANRGGLIVDPEVSVVSLVGDGAEEIEHIGSAAGREMAAAGVKLIATAMSASRCAVSFVVPHRQFRTALLELHSRISSPNLATAAAHVAAARIQ